MQDFLQTEQTGSLEVLKLLCLGFYCYCSIMKMVNTMKVRLDVLLFCRFACFHERSREGFSRSFFQLFLSVFSHGVDKNYWQLFLLNLFYFFMYLWRLRSLKNSSEWSWSTCSFLLLKFLLNVCKEKVLKFFLCKSIKGSNNLLSEHSRQFTASPRNQCLLLSSMYLYVLLHYNCSFLPQKYKILQLSDNGLPWLPGKKKETSSSKKQFC